MTTSGDSTSHETSDTGQSIRERVIGEYGGETPGPQLIIVAGLHGNEPAGVEASRRVIDRLHGERPAMRGRVVALIGNREALRREKRFVDADLNRMWAADQLAALHETDSARLSVEQFEQRDLIGSLESELNNGYHPVIVLDLHSTSAFGAPFCIISDTLSNRRIAFPWSVPVILGLEEAIDGTIQEYFGGRGHITAAVEGGQHRDPQTIERLESMLWITLVTGGFVREKDAPGLDGRRAVLRRACEGLPSVVEIFYRHGLSASNGFEMHPGFRNFSPVRKGQRVASDQEGEVRARANGMLILPNYQKVGNDGFFLGRRVRSFWLGLSTLARQTGLDRLLPLLPGIRGHATLPGAVVVTPTAPHRLVNGVFHLLGYQKCPSEEGKLIFRRRCEPDLKPARGGRAGSPGANRRPAGHEETAGDGPIGRSS